MKAVKFYCKFYCIWVPQMDHSVSSLSYQGSIVEAIAEAKRQKKVFLIYISGDNAESGQLEGSTWKNSLVADSVQKYCILLHVSEGSNDATNFSAIYPQKSAPCITAVGYNGVKLWQIEGFIDAETLASGLQKAWLSLHFQETILAAALVSKNSEQQDANSSSSTTVEQGSSSGMNIVSPSLTKNAESLENSELDAVEINNNMGHNHSDKDHEEMDINFGKMASPGSGSANTLDGYEDSLATSSAEKSKASLAPDKSDRNNTKLGNKAIENKLDSKVDDDKIKSGVKTETSQVSVDKEAEGSQDKNVDVVQDVKLKKSETLSKPTEVHLNIRLLDGATLQNKFFLTSTLKMVKQYVDANATIRGSYDLAVPYPRKVFNVQDLNKTLAELSLVGRQALIVVTPNQGSLSSHDQRGSTNYSDSPNSNTEGYFSLAKRFISYINPLSYLGGGASASNSAQEAPGKVRQYGKKSQIGFSDQALQLLHFDTLGDKLNRFSRTQRKGPNPGLQNTVRGTDAASSSNQKTPETDRNKGSKQAPLRFGSNIHTLKHDEDDSQTGDRNNFWNGNSTQYGGDNDPK